MPQGRIAGRLLERLFSVTVYFQAYKPHGARPLRRAGALAPGRRAHRRPRRPIATEQSRVAPPRITTRVARRLIAAAPCRLASADTTGEGADAAAVLRLHRRACSCCWRRWLAVTAETVTDFTLDNGMEVVVIEDHRAPVVVHMVWYKVGAADEPPGVSGIAHFLEHLMFKGTDTMAPGELSADRRGQWRLGQRLHQLGLHRLFPARRRRPAGADDEDGSRPDAQSASSTPDDVTTERDVILEERNQRTDNNPGALFGEQMRRRAVSQPSLRHPGDRLAARDGGADAGRGAGVLPHLLRAQQRDPGGGGRRRARRGEGAGRGSITAPLKPTPDLPARARPQEPPQLAARRLTHVRPARRRSPICIRTYLAPERNPGDQKTAAALTVLADLLGGDHATSVLGRGCSSTATWRSIPRRATTAPRSTRRPSG